MLNYQKVFYWNRWWRLSPTGFIGFTRATYWPKTEIGSVSSHRNDGAHWAISWGRRPILAKINSFFSAVMRRTRYGSKFGTTKVWDGWCGGLSFLTAQMRWFLVSEILNHPQLVWPGRMPSSIFHHIPKVWAKQQSDSIRLLISIVYYLYVNINNIHNISSIMLHII